MKRITSIVRSLGQIFVIFSPLTLLSLGSMHSLLPSKLLGSGEENGLIVSTKQMRINEIKYDLPESSLHFVQSWRIGRISSLLMKRGQQTTLCGRNGLRFMIQKILQLGLFSGGNHMVRCSGVHLPDEKKDPLSFGRRNGEGLLPRSISSSSFLLLCRSSDPTLTYAPSSMIMRRLIELISLRPLSRKWGSQLFVSLQTALI